MPALGFANCGQKTLDRKSTRLNSSHTEIYTLSLHDALPISLFICEWILVMMNFLQRAIVIFLDLYVPIALAEFSVHSLQNQGQAFFKNYVGVHEECLPLVLQTVDRKL